MTVSIASNVSSGTGSVGITGPTGVFSNLLFNGASPVSFSISNASAYLLNNWSVTSGASTGSLSLSPTSGTSLAGGTSTSVSGTYQAFTISPTAITTANVATATIGGTVNSTDPGGHRSHFRHGNREHRRRHGRQRRGGRVQREFTGTLLQGQVAAGATYAGLASIVTGGSGTITGNLGTVAAIMAGSNTTSSPTTVGMTWRTRATDELPGHATSPPMSGDEQSGLSDQRRGADHRHRPQRHHQSNRPLRRRMSFSPGQLTGTVSGNFSNGWLFLATLAGSGTGETWENPLAADHGANAPAGDKQVNNSWSSFYSGAGNPALSSIIGAWGVDTTNNMAWAVVNFDAAGGSDFAVVPESGTLVLLLVAAGGLTPVIRKRWKARRRANDGNGGSLR